MTEIKALVKLLFCSLALVLLGTACLDIEEEYYFRANGSGTARVAIDVTGIMGLLAMADELGDESSEEPSDSALDDLWSSDEMTNTLKAIPGITKVTSLTDQDKGIVGYSYEFANIDALNKATSSGGVLESVGGDKMAPATHDEGPTFTFSRKGLGRTYPPMKDDSASAEDLAMTAMMMEDNFYRVTYRFDQKIKKVKQKGGNVVTLDAHSITVENSLANLITGKASPNLAIKLK